MAETGNLPQRPCPPLSFQDVEQDNATVPSTPFTAAGTVPSLSDLLGGKMITFDEWDIGHLLSDSQLDAVSSGKDDTSFGIFTTAFGAGFGLLQNLFVAGSAVYKEEIPGPWDAIASLLCVASFAVAIAKYTEYRRNKSKTGDLVQEIKDRPKIKIPAQARSNEPST
jgi:hypothetical protein